MNDLISIITPIFNSEKWLSKCIESVLNQTYNNFELILINDGSTDNSNLICDTYSNLDPRIKVIHTTNKGVSHARNIGIKKSRGDYICFLDSDDMMKMDMCESIYKIFNDYNQIDTIIFGYEKMSDEKLCMPDIRGGIIDNPIDIINDYNQIHSRNILCASWRYAFNRKLIVKNNHLFKENIGLGEDTIFNLEAILNSKSIYVLNKSLYRYNDLNLDSAMRKEYKINHHEDINKNYVEKHKIIKKFNITNHEFIYDLHKYNIYNLVYNCLYDMFRGTIKDLYKNIKWLVNSEICIDGFSQFNIWELYINTYNKMDFILLLMCKYRINTGIYMYGKYINNRVKGE